MKEGKDGAPKPLGLAQLTGLLPPGQAVPGYYPGYGLGGYSYGFGGPGPFGYGALPSAPPQQQQQQQQQQQLQPQTIVMGGAAGGGSGHGNGCSGGCRGSCSGGCGGRDLVSSLSTLNGLKHLLQPKQAHRTRTRGLLIHAKKPGYLRVPLSPNPNRSSRGVRQVPTPTGSVHESAVPSNYSSHNSAVTVKSYKSRNRG